MKNLHNPFVVHHNRIPLSKKGIMHGAKYTSNRYSGDIMGAISLVFIKSVVSLMFGCLYVLNNELSRQIILNPNMEFIKQRLRKRIESTPLNAESSGRNWIGPTRKNLLIPNDEENKLKKKVIRGMAALKVSNVGIVIPVLSLG